MGYEDQLIVKYAYPDAHIVPERTYLGAVHYTCFDPRSGLYIGPTAFEEGTAWKYAAERLTKSQISEEVLWGGANG